MAEYPAVSVVESTAGTVSNRQRDERSEVGLSPWLTVREAATRARCGVKTIYREVNAGRLRAARVGGRRELRLLPEWVDAWLLMGSSGDRFA
jgi:excisionase family DNA binding protein